MFVDVHAHLEMCTNPEEAIKKSKDVLIITNSVDENSINKSLKSASEHDNVYAALGIYPKEAISMSEKEIDKMFDLIRKNKENIVAIGEVGLDKTYDNLPKQCDVFRKFIRLSKELHIPIIVHSRKAEKEAIDILVEESASDVVMHCFNGNFKLIKQIVENGWMITIPLSIMRSHHFQKIANEVPLKNILTETDSPYLGDGEENIPYNVRFIVEKIASLTQHDSSEVEHIIFENFVRVFNISR